MHLIFKKKVEISAPKAKYEIAQCAYVINLKKNCITKNIMFTDKKTNFLVYFIRDKNIQ